MKAIHYFLVVCIIAVSVPSVVFAEEETLNVTTKGLDHIEQNIIETKLTKYELPLNTPINIEKGVIVRDWNGRQTKFDSVKVTIETPSGQFIGSVSDRGYPQFPGEEYYGLLQVALGHACQGPERLQFEAKLDVAFSSIEEAVTKKAENYGHSVIFHEWNRGIAEAFFTVDDVLCKVRYWVNGDNSPAYFVVDDGAIKSVENLEAIFFSDLLVKN